MESKLLIISVVISILVCVSESAPIGEDDLQVFEEFQQLMKHDKNFEQFLLQDKDVQQFMAQDRTSKVPHTGLQRRDGDLRRKQWFWLAYYRENLKPLLHTILEYSKIKLREYTIALHDFLQEEIVNSSVRRR